MPSLPPPPLPDNEDTIPIEDRKKFPMGGVLVFFSVAA
jgi:hypothetical protein